MLTHDQIIVSSKKSDLISPLDINNVSVCSYDCTLFEYVKKQGEKDFEKVDISNKPYELKPQEFILAATNEYFRIPLDLCGFVAGKSTIARNGLIVEAAGLLDPGFHGQVVLEIFNMSRWSLFLKKNMLICQAYFIPTRNNVGDFCSYAVLGSYGGQRGVTEPRYRLDDPNWAIDN